MHILVSCDNCARQYDSIGRATGQQFRCICGVLLTVPELDIFEARVVRCASCAAIRESGQRQCGFCNADFTAHERDMHTICPHCMARISDHSKYCHHCAKPIVVSGTAGQAVSNSCPACRKQPSLFDRHISGHDISVLECNICTGMWLDKETFLFLEQKMLELAASNIDGSEKHVRKSLPKQPVDDHNLYRKCPVCEVVMHRRNYGPGSGIVIDQCHHHGFWFDHQELAVIMRWIRTGGLLASKQRRMATKRDNDRLERLLKKMEQNRLKQHGANEAKGRLF